MAGCAYSFSTTTRPLESAIIPTGWQCPFDDTHGEYCAFHAEDAGPDVQQELFEKMLTTGDSDSATTQVLDIVGATLDIPIRLVTFAELNKIDEIRFHNCEFTESIDLSGIHITGDCSFAGSVFHDDFSLEDATIRGELNLSDTEYTKSGSVVMLNGIRCELSLIVSNLHNGAVSVEHAVIQGDCRFDGVELDELSLARTRTEGKLVIRGDVGLLRLMQAVILNRGGTTFRNGENATANIDFGSFGHIIASECRIEGDAEISTTKQIDCKNAQITGRLRIRGGNSIELCEFSGAEIGGGLEIIDSSLNQFTLGGRPTLDQPGDIDGRIVLDITLCGDLDLSGANIDGLQLTVNDVDAEDGMPVIDCAETEIETGEITSETAAHWEIDFTNATLGNIKLTGWGENAGELSDVVRIFDTAFNGFEFEQPANRRLFDKSGWSPITPAAHRQREVTSDAMISSAVKAKNGANFVGAKRIAGRFFMHEMNTRTRYAWEQARELTGTSRVWATIRAVKMSALGSTTGYGERPSRVLGWSVGIIGVFTVVYYPSVQGPTVGRAVLDAALLSIQSFSTLVLGAPSQTQQPLLRLLTAVEGFVGAFFVALFVFTMTRTLYR